MFREARGRVIFAVMESDPRQAMAVDIQRVLIIGLPETGKTSFIQALDEVLKHPASAQDLCASGLAHDRSYIQSARPIFLRGKSLAVHFDR